MNMRGYRIFARKSLGSNIVDLNRFYDFGEAKLAKGPGIFSPGHFRPCQSAATRELKWCLRRRSTSRENKLIYHK